MEHRNMAAVFIHVLAPKVMRTTKGDAHNDKIDCVRSPFNCAAENRQSMFSSLKLAIAPSLPSLHCTSSRRPLRSPPLYLRIAFSASDPLVKTTTADAKPSLSCITSTDSIGHAETSPKASARSFAVISGGRFPKCTLCGPCSFICVECAVLGRCDPHKASTLGLAGGECKSSSAGLS